MKTKRLIVLLVLLIGLLASACAPSAQSDLADRFAGTWSGPMSFTDRNHTEDVFVTIPSDCAIGDVCGEIFNAAVNCTWEVQLEAIKGDIFEYTFSKTLSGECPAMGNGTLTLQEAEGTLVREHKTPDFTSSGILGRQAEGYKPMYGFAGIWSGAVSFSDDPDRKHDMEFSIPVGCKDGNTCGGMVDYTANCGVSMTLASASASVFKYEFPTVNVMECPYGGAGTLTLQPDGSFLLEHTSPNLTMNGELSRK